VLSLLYILCHSQSIYTVPFSIYIYCIYHIYCIFSTYTVYIIVIFCLLPRYCRLPCHKSFTVHVTNKTVDWLGPVSRALVRGRAGGHHGQGALPGGHQRLHSAAALHLRLLHRHQGPLLRLALQRQWHHDQGTQDLLQDSQGFISLIIIHPLNGDQWHDNTPFLYFLQGKSTRSVKRYR